MIIHEKGTQNEHFLWQALCHSAHCVTSICTLEIDITTAEY